MTRLSVSAPKQAMADEVRGGIWEIPTSFKSARKHLTVLLRIVFGSGILDDKPGRNDVFNIAQDNTVTLGPVFSLHIIPPSRIDEIGRKLGWVFHPRTNTILSPHRDGALNLVPANR